MELRHIKKV